MRRKTNNKNDTSSRKRNVTSTKKKEPKKATKGIYKEIEYDSLEELAMLQWLFELKAAGYIKKIARAESYLLSMAYVNDYVENMKRVSSKPMTQTLLHGHSYTPEFEVHWDKKALDKFIWMSGQGKMTKVFIGYEFENNPGSYVTYIEVKPLFDQNNMERLFKLNQKWMWQNYSIFINLVKVKDLFEKTFTPKEYLTTPSGKKRVLKWKPKTLFSYVNKSQNDKR
jgi:hypothetical protein